MTAGNRLARYLSASKNCGELSNTKNNFSLDAQSNRPHFESSKIEQTIFGSVKLQLSDE